VVELDEDPPNPRENADPLGEIIYRSHRYVLGDVDVREKYGSVEAFEERLGEVNALAVRVFAYIHRDVVLEAADGNPFYGRVPQGHAEFDSGQSGVVWVSSDRISETYGEDTPETRRKAREVLVSEVREFSSYLNGECYIVSIFLSGDEVCRLGTVFGSEQRAQAIEEARRIVDEDRMRRMEKTFDIPMYQDR
jgi:hypothetical protein